MFHDSIGVFDCRWRDYEHFHFQISYNSMVSHMVDEDKAL